MKTPTIVLLIVVISVIISGCSDGTKVTHITGGVVSEQPVKDKTKDNAGQHPQDIMEDVRVDSENASEATVTRERDEIMSSMKCDRDRVMLGFRSCYNTSNGKAAVYLKSSGYNDIPGLWFNIEVDDKPNYEYTSRGLYGDGFVEYTLDLPEWSQKYGSADRILIIPVREKSGERFMCHNRALLLEPKESCTQLIQR